MSGAEFIAVISLGASIIQVADACHRLIIRIQDFRENSGFDELTAQLRLLCCDLDAIKTLHRRQGLDNDTEAILAPILQDCRKQVVKLEKLVDAILPPKHSPAFRRKLHAIMAFAKDRRVQQALQQLDRYKQTLTLHLAVHTCQNAAMLPRILSCLAVSTIQNPDLTTDRIDAASDLRSAMPARRTYSMTSSTATASRGNIGHCCPCACHISICGILLCRCHCGGRRISRSFRLLNKLISIDLNILTSRSLGDFAIKLRIANQVKWTSPGSLVVAKLIRGCITPAEAKVEFRNLTERKLIDYGDSCAGHGYSSLAVMWALERVSGSSHAAGFLDLLGTMIDAGFSKPATSLLFWRCINHSTNDLLGRLIHGILEHADLDISAIKSGQLANWACSTQFDNWHFKSGPHRVWRDTDDIFGVHGLRRLVGFDRDFPGMTTLQSAVLAGVYDDVQRFLRGAYREKTEKNLRGQATLHLAVSDARILALLLRNGFDDHVDIEDNDGITPLIYAAVYGETDSALLLLEAGADPFHKDGPNRFDLWAYAAILGQNDFLTSVLRYLQGRWDATFWHKKLDQVAWRCAAWRNMSYCCSKPNVADKLFELFDMGADELQISQKGNSILHMVASSAEGKELIPRISPLINQENSRKCTPLMVFCALYDSELIRLAIQYGANVEVVDWNLLGPLDYLLESNPVRVTSCSEDFERYSNQVCNWMESGATLLASGANILHTDSCLCPCTHNGCSPLKMLFSSAPHESDAIEKNLAAIPWAIEWYLLVKEILGEEVGGTVVAGWNKLQTFDGLGMVHTCCSVYCRHIINPRATEGPSEDEDEKHEVWSRTRAEDLRQEAEEIQKEQEEYRILLEEACSKFEKKQPTLEAQGILHVLARRSVMMEESPHNRKEPPWQEVLCENPFLAVNYEKDFVAFVERPFVAVESALAQYLRVVETQQPDYSKAVQVGAGCHKKIDISRERRRLCTLLLEEVEKVRSLSQDEKDWEPNWYVPASFENTGGRVGGECGYILYRHVR